MMLLPTQFLMAPPIVILQSADVDIVWDGIKMVNRMETNPPIIID